MHCLMDTPYTQLSQRLQLSPTAIIIATTLACARYRQHVGHHPLS
jgi:hypothetical protein